jgi:hypothetical protein
VSSVDEYYGCPCAAVKRQDHFLRDKKIKFTNVSCFSEQKNTLPNHHVYHAIHHVLTSKKPRSKRRFFANPQQSHDFASRKKYGPEIHRNPHLG